jgi:hypothetical protein
MNEVPPVPAGVDTGSADLREPDAILDHQALRKPIDLSEPVGLLMTGVMMFVSDTSDPWALVSR